MHYFLYPTADTYITNDPDYMFKNMGIDEILQVQKNMSYYSCGSVSGSLGSVLSRTLMLFDLTQISKSIADGDIVNPTFTLNLKICESQQVPVAYTLLSFPMVMPWSMGTGYRYDGQITANGANWKFSDGSTTWWYSGSLTTWWYSGSLYDCSGGGTWRETSGSVDYGFPYPVTGGFECSQSFNYQSSDVSMDVTTIASAWLGGVTPNLGLIVMYQDETSSVDYGCLKFFSKETNTVYSPYLDVAWDDSFYDSASVSNTDPIDITDAVVTIKNMPAEYKFGSLVRMNVVARQRYPQKTFTNMLSDYLTPYYLPSGSSFYSIKDAESEMEIIPYDDCTQLSYDANGNFFMLDTTGLPSERYFKVEIRAEQSGSIFTFPISTAFKISR
jgi:hypothetical protein